MKNKQTRKKIGLALGSGAWRGFAHIGVIKSFLKNGIEIDFLSGSSMGALIAAYYAVFKDINKLEDEFVANAKDNMPLFLNFSLTGGLIGGNKFLRYLNKRFQNFKFSDSLIPLQIIATDLFSGKPYIFSDGDIARAIRASVSVPLVFKPLKYKDKLLVDGGLSNPVPGVLVRKMGADIVIGVNIYHQNEFIAKKLTMPQVVLRSTRIVLYNLAQNDIKDIDIVIAPDLSPFVATSSLSKFFTKEVIINIINAGEKAADKKIDEIKRLIN